GTTWVLASRMWRRSRRSSTRCWRTGCTCRPRRTRPGSSPRPSTTRPWRSSQPHCPMPPGPQHGQGLRTKGVQGEHEERACEPRSCERKASTCEHEERACEPRSCERKASTCEHEERACEPRSCERKAMTVSETVVHMLRHGEVANPTRILYGRLPGFRLSPLGEQMALAAAESLAGRDITLVVSSPLERAVQTAEPVAAKFGLPVEIDERLIESANFFEGKRVG